MKREDVSRVRQLITSMYNLVPFMEEAYRSKNAEKFNQYKRMFLNFGEEIRNIKNGI